jgi:hypothetical protein
MRIRILLAPALLTLACFGQDPAPRITPQPNYLKRFSPLPGQGVLSSLGDRQVLVSHTPDTDAAIPAGGCGHIKVYAPDSSIDSRIVAKRQSAVVSKMPIHSGMPPCAAPVR